MTSPRVKQYVSQVFDVSETTSHAVSMPTTVIKGDLILALIANAINATITTPLDWVLIGQLLNTGGTVRFSLYAKRALGTEGGTTVDFVTSTTVKIVAQVETIENWYDDGTPLTYAVGLTALSYLTATSGDPPLIDTSLISTDWLSKDNLYIAGVATENVSGAPSSVSAGYTLQSYDNTPTVSTNGRISLISARSFGTATTEDPGVVTYINTQAGVAFTIAVRSAVISESKVVDSNEGVDAPTSSINVSFGTVTRRKAAQTFRSVDGLVTSARLYLKKTGVPTGAIIFASIYEINNSGSPTDTIVVDATTVVDIATLSTVTPRWVEFKFPPTRLRAGWYALVVACNGGGDADYLNVIENIFDTHPGVAYYRDSNSWFIESTGQRDLLFSVSETVTSYESGEPQPRPRRTFFDFNLQSAYNFLSYFSKASSGASQSYKDIATRFRLSARSYKDIQTRFTLAVRGYKDVQTRVRITAQSFKDVTTRFRLNVLGYKDVQTRARITVRGFKDVATRFTLNARSYKDIQTRFLLALRGYKDVGLRARIIAQAYQDIKTRFTLVVRGYKDIQTRFRLTAQSYKDIQTRFRMTAQSYKDITTRFRLTVQGYKDVGLRARIIARSYADIATRFRLTVQAYKDIQARFRLSARSFKDIQTRFTLMARAYKDIQARFRLTVQGYKDVGLRARIIARSYQDIATRFRLTVQGYKDVQARARITVRGFKDVGARFNLTVPYVYKDVALRARLVVQAYKDIQTRFTLTVRGFKDVQTRFRLTVQGYKDVATRSRIIVQSYKDITSRFRFTVQAYKDIGLRSRIIAQAFKNIATRFTLNVRSYKDVATRFVLAAFSPVVASETVTATESTSTLAILSDSDSLTATESPTTTQVFVNLNEPVTATDIVTSIFVTLTDNESITATESTLVTVPITDSDTVTATESPTDITFIFPVNASDTVTATDRDRFIFSTEVTGGGGAAGGSVVGGGKPIKPFDIEHLPIEIMTNYVDADDKAGFTETTEIVAFIEDNDWAYAREATTTPERRQGLMAQLADLDLLLDQGVIDNGLYRLLRDEAKRNAPL